jgi:cell division transport system permease protein
MFLAYFVAAAFILISVGSSILISYFESRPAVTAFLRDGTTNEQVKGVQDRLVESGVVSKTKYISKDEALAIYRERNKDEPLLNEFVTADILPASIEVSTFELKDLNQIASILSGEKVVEEVVFQKSIVDTLNAWTNTIRYVGGGVIGFLLLTSLFITLIVIGLNISLHEDEIEIMKLVGATSSYVRLPFIFEGMFYGIFSAVLASGLLLAFYLWAAPSLEKIFSGIPLLVAAPATFVYIFIGEIAMGMTIGIVGGYLATKRYLNV